MPALDGRSDQLTRVSSSPQDWDSVSRTWGNAGGFQEVNKWKTRWSSVYHLSLSSSSKAVGEKWVLWKVNLTG